MGDDMTKARRTDTNHAEIRDALRGLGYRVVDTSRMGTGFPDLIAIMPDGRVVMIEIKRPGGGFTSDEVEFIVSLANPAYRVAYDVDAAVMAIRSMTNE